VQGAEEMLKLHSSAPKKIVEARSTSCAIAEIETRPSRSVTVKNLIADGSIIFYSGYLSFTILIAE